MVCCCDPFEPLSAEESMQVEKESISLMASTGGHGKIYDEELLVSGT
jgi:hypothetical protein